jgi:hypothetical protein
MQDAMKLNRRASKRKWIEEGILIVRVFCIFTTNRGSGERVDDVDLVS